ncbi:GLTPD1 [Bugula neritina]|uniref:GLTPD1 n=1 Tax=Bugula neritina TaxID=10212 RepID=A0A7J7KEH3_BUGNE|nr:GLTPD1 [Bugula neritina]
MDTLGTLFHFVTHDVKQKLDILEAYLKSDPQHYETVHKIIRYEVDNNLTKTKKPSGSRTFLRLHRALNYILELFDKLATASNDAKCSTLSQDAYSYTLGKFHPWIVRKAATLAMYSLPVRGSLLQRIDSSEGSEERVVQILKDITKSGKLIYDSVDSLYTKEKLHDLP